MRVLLVLSLCLFHASIFAASAMDQLNRFHDDIRTIEADFHQELKDANDNMVQESKGKVWIKRPGLFRWEYNEPYPQTIVADGLRIWIYDPELDQVTVKQEDSAMGNAPALVLSGKHPLDRDFKLIEVDRGDKHQWVTLVPKQDDADFAEISVAFLNDVLALLELKDKLGQRTLIHFKSLKTNADIDTTKFHFNVPPGTDVIGGDQL